MTECIADRSGNWLYAGTPKNFAGELNRFDCSQDVYMADIHHVHVRPELAGVLEKASDPRTFAEELRKQGYLILYDPRA
jgi:hypothetical protein